MNIDPKKKKILIAGGCLAVSGLLLCSVYQGTPDIPVPQSQNVSLRAGVSDISIEDILKSSDNRKPVEPVRDELVRGAITGPVASDISLSQDDPQDIARVQALIRESEENATNSIQEIEYERRGGRVDETAHQPVVPAIKKESIVKTVVPDTTQLAEPEEDVDTVSATPVKISPFNSLRLAKTDSKNAIKAYVHSEQVVMEGSTLKLRLGEKAYTDNGVLIPRNSPVYGVVISIDGERVQVRVTSVNVNGNILPFAKSVYSKDALLGIYVPGNPKADASKEVTAGALDGLPTTGLAGVDAATRIAGVVASSAANAGKQVLSQNIKKIKVTIKTNYEVYLRPDTRK